MRIVVTGSSGRIGRAVLEELLDHGHDVLPVDVHPREPADAPPTVVRDLARFDEIPPLFDGADALVHLANYPGFGQCGLAGGFANNVTTTFNVVQAATDAGVRRVVNASSVQAYGVLFSSPEAPQVSAPRYLPIDEDHPLLPISPYALSKATGEHIVEAFVRRLPQMHAFSLRFTSVESDEAAARHRAMAQRQRQHPKPPSQPRPIRRQGLLGDLQTRVHVKDAARAVRLCCEADRPGHTPLNIVSPRSRRPWSLEMFQEQYGVRPPLHRPIGPDDALFDPARAREVLGFVAEMPSPQPSQELIDEMARKLS